MTDDQEHMESPPMISVEISAITAQRLMSGMREEIEWFNRRFPSLRAAWTDGALTIQAANAESKSRVDLCEAGGELRSITVWLDTEEWCKVTDPEIDETLGRYFGMLGVSSWGVEHAASMILNADERDEFHRRRAIRDRELLRDMLIEKRPQLERAKRYRAGLDLTL